ncbi:ATP-dependent RNA helicase [Mycena kentingensis (nom. inval.)]|nr:ATP-dependent RNA helicase [Mycena kentingensis (nom. inval.)]
MQQPTRPLSSQQERRLTAWLDDEMLKLTRGYKKRTQPDSALQTLPDYLDAAQTILSVVLQIPPLDPSAALRVAYLLRLTNDVLGAIPGYLAEVQDIQTILNWLDDLDNSWVVVLQAQVWHSDTGPADLELDAELLASGKIRVSPVTQTERTRLRSLLIGGSVALEEWVDAGGLLHCPVGDAEDEDGGTVQDAFQELFYRTLRELGELGGVLHALMFRLWAACRPSPILGVRFRSGGPKSPKSFPKNHDAPRPSRVRRVAIPRPAVPVIPTDGPVHFHAHAEDWSKGPVAKRLVAFGASEEEAAQLLNAFVGAVNAGYFKAPAKAEDEEIVFSQVFFRWLKTRPRTGAVSCLLRVSEAASNLYPIESFETARRMKRKFIMHVGPTNSGKTHHALRALAAAQSGVYAGPLRLLAHEIWERFNIGQVVPLGATEEDIAAAKSVPFGIDHPFARKCNMVTGEEVKIVDDLSGLASCTVEMLSLSKRVEVAVIDEIQMMLDPYRGSVWTDVVLGMCADEIHLCGEDTVVPLVRRILEQTGDELVVREYERLTPLSVESTSLNNDLTRIQQGDCVVAFSRRAIFGLKRRIEQQTPMKVAVVYGKLPPEVRSQQAALFNAEDSGYDVLVGSDAIGMGLNLKIRRVIFEAVSKYNGARERPLSISQIKQIAGRAGRFGMQTADATPGGFVTTLREIDLPTVQRTLPLPNVRAKFVRISTPKTNLPMVIAALPENATSKTWLEATMYAGLFAPGYLPKQINHVESLSEFIDSHPFSIKDRTLLLDAPLPWRDPPSWPAVASFLRSYFDGFIELRPLMREHGLDDQLLDTEYAMKMGTRRDGSRFDVISELGRLEATHKILMVYIWLSYRNPVTAADFVLAQEYKERVERGLHWCLEELTLQTGGTMRADDTNTAPLRPAIPSTPRKTREKIGELRERLRQVQKELRE